MVAVRYFSRSGNIQKLAKAIADTLHTEAETTDADLTEKADILFLGSAVYAGKFDPAVGAFLERNKEKIGMLAVFSSSASGKSTYGKLKEFAENRGISVSEKQFVCPGHFLFLHRGRPDESDLKNAQAFAQDVCAGRNA